MDICITNAVNGEQLCMLKPEPQWTEMDLRDAVSQLLNIQTFEFALLFNGAEIVAEACISEVVGKTSGKEVIDIGLVRRLDKEQSELVRQITTGTSLGSLGSQHWGTFSVVLAAVQRDGLELRFASPKLKANKRIVHDAVTLVKQNGLSLTLTVHKLQQDREVVQSALQQNGNALKFAPKELLSDKDTVRTAVSQNGGALQYASPELRSDKEIVLEAVRSQPSAMVFAASHLQCDKDVRFAAANTIRPFIICRGP